MSCPAQARIAGSRIRAVLAHHLPTEELGGLVIRSAPGGMEVDTRCHRVRITGAVQYLWGHDGPQAWTVEVEPGGWSG